jgi:hypothetical protein
MLNRLKKYYLFFIIQLFFVVQSWAQSQILSTNPPNLKWYQINSQHFNILFEGGFLKEGLRIANTMEELYKPVSQSLGITPKKISIILQNHNSISNGFVSQTPRRSEFFTMPTQDYNFTGMLDWMDLLAVHEFRHVVQFDKSVTKFNKAVFYVLGYNASSSLAHIAVPEWFWEGDAVVIETALTKGGRGRIPNFGMLMRTNTLERGTFNYYRQYLRSFKYQVQDHYTFGYYMTSYLRNHYGDKIISETTRQAWAWPFIPFRFSNRIKKYSGKSLLQNYKSMMVELDSLWRKQINQRNFSRYNQINFRYSNAYTDYSYPQYLNDGSIVSLKSGIGDIPTFVKFDQSGKDKKVSVPGIINSTGMLSVANDIIAWNEIEFDPRWGNQTYSVIKIYDLKNKKIRRVSRKSRYSSAALSPDGKLIVTIETTHDSKYKIVIIDTGTGKMIGEIPNPQNYFFQNPRWSDDGSKIVAVKQSKAGKTIWIYDLESSTEEDLWELSLENIGYPVLHKKYVFYNSPLDGLDNVYAIQIDTKERFRVTSGKFGSYNAVISSEGDKILYNNFSKDGFDVVEIDFDSSSWVPVNQIIPNPENYFEPIAIQEGNINIVDSVKDESFPVKRYRLGAKILNPYSWGPILESTDLDLFIGISSKDIMGTSVLDLGYQFNANEETGQWIGNFSYQGIYPVLNARGYIGNRAVTERFAVRDDGGNIIGDTLSRVTWNESGFLLGAELPFKLTRSKYLQDLRIGFNYNYSYVKDYSSYESLRFPDMQADGSLLSNEYYFSYRRMLRTSKRDLYGKFGQFLYLQYENTPWKASKYEGEMFAAQLRLFFPGLFKHHSFNYRVGYQWQLYDRNNNDIYLFNSPIFWTRGYSYRIFDNYLNNSFNYAFPVIYPDLPIWSLLNIQRIYTNFFVDIGRGYIYERPLEGIPEQINYSRSVGVEVSFDFNVMRFLSMFNMGFRYVYAIDNENNPHQWSLLIGDFGF